MVRGSLAESAPYGYAGVTPKHGTELLWRTTADRPGVSQQLGDEPLSHSWYRLDCRENVVTASLSADGERWHSVDQRRVDVGDSVLAGLVVCSHMPGTRCQATFESVDVTPFDVE